MNEYNHNLVNISSSRWLVRLSLVRKILRSLCLALVILQTKATEEHEDEMASCLHSLSRALKRMEAL